MPAQGRHVRLLTLPKSPRFKDLTGNTYGERVVTGFSHQNPKSGNYYWKVKCNCGREGIVSGSRLKLSSSKCISCSGKVNGRKGLHSMSKSKPVYFIKCNEFLKVGSSDNPGRRVRDMVSPNPYEVELIKVDTDNNEEYWHDLLKECHYKGEWYWYNKVCEIVDV